MKAKHLAPYIAFVLAVVGIHLVTLAMEKEYCLSQATMAVYYAIVVMGLCLVMGYAGQVSLGHGAFFAIGGYTSAVLTTYDFTRFQGAAWARALAFFHVFVPNEDMFGAQVVNVNPWAAFVVAMLATAAIAAAVGYPALRLKGHYLAMATLGFVVIVNKIVLGSSITGAADGVTNVPAWNLGAGLSICGKSADRVQNYYIACGLALVLLALARNLVRSRVGRAMQAIHDRETAANAIGIDTATYKLKTFVLSAMLAAIAGVCLTHYTGGIGPGEASALKSVRYVALAAAGGMSNLWGGVIVSSTINYLSLRDWFGSYDNAVFGTLLIVIISIAPEGPFKEAGAFIRRIARRGSSPAGGSHGAS